MNKAIWKKSNRWCRVWDQAWDKNKGVPNWKMLKFNESKSLDNVLYICPIGIPSWNKLIGVLTNLIIISLWKYLPSLIIPMVNKYILLIIKTYWINHVLNKHQKASILISYYFDILLGFPAKTKTPTTSRFLHYLIAT